VALRRRKLTGYCIKLHRMELHDLCSLPNIIGLIKVQVLTGEGTGAQGRKDESILGRQLDVWSKMILRRIWKKCDKVRVEYILLA
jgi:hypothetical protein